MLDYVGSRLPSMTEGGLWMLHQYVKQARFDANTTALLLAWRGLVNELGVQAGKTEAAPGSLHPANGTYHITHCNSPEYVEMLGGCIRVRPSLRRVAIHPRHGGGRA